MFGSIVIEVAVGLVLVYLTFSLLCSAVNEWIARLLALRAAGLRKGINELFCDVKEAGFADAFHNHALVEALKPSKSPVLRRFLPAGLRVRYPSYISAQTFALAVMELTSDITSPGSPGVAVRAMLKSPAKRATPFPPAIESLLVTAEGDAALMQRRLEDWFNDSMDRVSGWYKRRAHVILLVIGLCVAFVFNVDTFRVVHQLATEPTVREALVKQADAIVENARATSSDTLPLKEISKRIADLQHSGVSMGWDEACSPRAWLSGSADGAVCGSGWKNLLGLLVTALALSFGAPFWFDALNKLVNLRQAGTPPGDAKRK